jgi:hypothetical protein
MTSSAYTARQQLVSAWSLSVRLALAMLFLAFGYLAAAYVGNVPPLRQHHDPFAASAILDRLPPDFPIPPDSHVELAGRGAQLPFHVQWTSAEPVPAVAAIYEDLLKSGNWELMLREEASPSYRIRLARLGPDDSMTHWAILDVSPQEGGSRVSLDFMVTQGLTVTLN